MPVPYTGGCPIRGFCGSLIAQTTETADGIVVSNASASTVAGAPADAPPSETPPADGSPSDAPAGGGAVESLKSCGRALVASGGAALATPEACLRTAWRAVIALSVLVAFIAIIAANNNDTDMDGNRGAGFAAVWACFVVALVEIGGTYVVFDSTGLRKHDERELAVGWLLGALVMTSQVSQPTRHTTERDDPAMCRTRHAPTRASCRSAVGVASVRRIDSKKMLACSPGRLPTTCTTRRKTHA